MQDATNNNNPRPKQERTNSLSLKTDGGKTKSNAIEIPSISLPKGGGAIKGIDEKFSVNAVNGSATLSIPLPVSQARAVTPSLALSYNSGSGNGIFGLGWSLNLPSIKRKTDKQLPQYQDNIESDVFLFSEAEDLVPVFKKRKVSDGGKQEFEIESGHYVIEETERVLSEVAYIIRQYRPRIEGLFARIERWTEKVTGRIKWRVITKDNTTTLFGWTDKSVLPVPDDASEKSYTVISDPDNPLKIFEWLPEFVFDDKGNCSRYIYKPEDEMGSDSSFLHNKNRFKGKNITYTNIYLEKVLYCNKTPYEKFGVAFPDPGKFLFETVFDYGEANTDDHFDNSKWYFRPDAFSEYKSGFEIRTTRRCNRVLLFHHFKGANEYDGLVRSLNFKYDSSTEQDFTFLKSITSVGYIRKAGGSYSSKELPPLEFEYQKHDWSTDIKTLSTEDIIHAPVGIEGNAYQFVDLFNEGLSGILTEQADGWYYKHNLGKWIDENGNQTAPMFSPAKLVSPKPSFSGMGSVTQLADLDADGGKQLVSYSNEPSGYFELNDDSDWEPYRSFPALPNIDFNDTNTRMIDLNGDGRAELVISEDNVFTWYESEGRNGFKGAIKTIKSFDEETGPAMIFAEATQTIFLADMSGSGMTDILRIRNGEICYWPNLGYGKFGAKITMDNAPLFDHTDSFNPAYIRLADIDGSGTTDIIYLGKNKYTCYKNLSGNSFAQPYYIDVFPQIHTQAKITVTDLLGNGVACIVWSSPLSKDANAPVKYIDLMNSKKPHIMVAYKNNMGKEVALEYAPSTRYYIEDKLKGTPWVTKLHFPVHCISKQTVEDKITGHKFTSLYKYHHGYYDHPEREFRGFGMVEQTDSDVFLPDGTTNMTDEHLYQPPVTTKTWFHTGAFLRKGKMLNQFENDYWYKDPLVKQLLHSEMALRDATVIDMHGNAVTNMTAEEWQQAFRACKGMALRSEVFTYDAEKRIVEEKSKHNYTDDDIDFLKFQEAARITEKKPYTVATHNCVIELLQPKAQNNHAVFIVKESEAITYNYERNIDDPRIAHTLNLRLDEYGNVLESASVVYSRKLEKIGVELPAETKEAQSKIRIIYTQNHFTNEILDKEDVNRLPLPSEAKTYELKNLSKSYAYYAISDFEGILTNADSALYHEIDKPFTEGTAQMRLIEHTRTLYYENELTGPLKLHQLESLAIPYESYQLAFTPELFEDIYADKTGDAESTGLLMQDYGKYCHFKDKEGNEDSNWWIRSGFTQYISVVKTIADAVSRFYSPLFFTDPFGSVTSVEYYPEYSLFISKVIDAVTNETSVQYIDNSRPGFNFRTLTAEWIKDMNGNFSASISDELGFVKAMAILGKVDAAGISEADDLEGIPEQTDPEKDFIDIFLRGSVSADGTTNYSSMKPAAWELLKNATTRFIYDLNAYKDSASPAVVASVSREQHARQLKDSPVQIAFEYSSGVGNVVMKKVQAAPGLVGKMNTGDNLRWIGTGRTILNNKGNPVKQYEPYFSITHQYENDPAIVEQGVAITMHYDALSRLIRINMPDGSLSRVEFDSWQQILYDANDTVNENESTWLANRNGESEMAAAEKAKKHANTPLTLHFDTLGRPVLQVEHNGWTDYEKTIPILFNTSVLLDVEGNLRSVTDARGNIVMQYKYDMLGNMVYQQSMDAGKRWMLNNAVGKPIRKWDERDHEFQYEYDLLQRPVISRLIRTDLPVEEGAENAPESVFDWIIYGEGVSINGKTDQQLNLRGKPYRHYDTGGLLESPDYDFKGQAKFTKRKLFSKYKEIPHWWYDDPDAPIANLEGEYIFTTETDALGRITRQEAPGENIIIPSYNETGLLNGEKVRHKGATDDTVYIKNIEYNEKGQRTKIIYGNDVFTKFYYDTATFRLIQLETNRKNGEKLQDLHYTYDAVGNITHIVDKVAPVVFYRNSEISSQCTYTYDALYRLIEATGRENNAAMVFAPNDNWNDAPFMHQHNPGSAMDIDSYKEVYKYDAVGNIEEMHHYAARNEWERINTYYPDSNRLDTSTVAGKTYNYAHHAQHGYITKLPHLTKMEWNFKEELFATSTQVVNSGNGTAETTYYQYDANGQRIRKITENYAKKDKPLTKKDERIYIAGYETYRTYNDNNITFERESLSLMDGDHRFVMIETVKKNERASDSPPLGELEGAVLVRYQLHNHLGSACLELDGMNDANIISYEEYHPFGTTAYQANNANIKAAAKRYRYSGMERDEETGLEYHSARYYLPWLGRWLSADPIGIGDGVNVYGYCKNNSIIFNDRKGEAIRYFEILFLGTEASDSELEQYNENPEAHYIGFVATGAATLLVAGAGAAAVAPGAVANMGRLLKVAKEAKALTKASIALAATTLAVEGETAIDVGNVALATFDVLNDGGTQAVVGLEAALLDLGTGLSPLGEVNSARILSKHRREQHQSAPTSNVEKKTFHDKEDTPLQSDETVLIDTSVISALRRGNEDVKRKFESARQQGILFQIPTPAVHEASKGAFGPARLQLLKELGITINDGNGLSSREMFYARTVADQIKFEGLEKLKFETPFDLIIGSHALGIDLPLWTLDGRSTQSFQQLGFQLDLNHILSSEKSFLLKPRIE